MSQTLENGLKVLTTLADMCSQRNEAYVPLREIAATTSMNKSTTYRLLRSFAKFGFVETDDNGAYGLGSAAFLLARATIGRNTLLSSAAPIMRQLAQTTNETVSLSERHGLRNVTIYEIESDQPVRYANKIGSSAPLNAGAGARVVLAFSEPSILEEVLANPLERVTQRTLSDPDALRAQLLKVREAGFAVSSGERVLGTNSVSVPILKADGCTRGAISVLWPSRGADVDRKRISAWPELLKEAVRPLQGV